MELEVLLSCMDKTEFSIIEDSNLIDVNTLIINQCDRNERIILDSRHRVINTITRGLSVSRNMALDNSKGDICLLCDDDEILVDGLEKIILDTYNQVIDADIILFKVINNSKFSGRKIKRLSKFELLKAASVQISFKKQSVLGKVRFDPLLGAGTPSGAGEENKFLLDCHKLGMKIYYVPIGILTLNDSDSSWFDGFNKNYFYKRGFTTRYVYGLGTAIIYAAYFVVAKRKRYKNTISFRDAVHFLYKGIRDNCIQEQKRQNSYENDM